MAPILHVVLIEPQIPPNTGNIARLCVATQVRLHLVEPLGFQITDSKLRRAGLDYWPHVDLRRHACWQDFRTSIGMARCFFFSKNGSKSYLQAGFSLGDCLVFGNEERGLPQWVFHHHHQVLTIPMFGSAVRSLNLASAAAIVTYEALRQIGRLR